MGGSRGGPYRYSAEHLRYIREYVAVFLETAGDPPWPCDRCKGDVHAVIGRNGLVHHRDEDETNADPSNLGAMHRSCHTAEHMAGRPSPKRGTHGKPLTAAQSSALVAHRRRAMIEAGRFLSDTQVDYAVEQYAHGALQREIAEELGFSQTAVSRAIRSRLSRSEMRTIRNTGGRRA